MLEVGDKAPLEAVVWTTPRERATIGDLIHAEASTAKPRRRHPPRALLFYLFDWSST